MKLVKYYVLCVVLFSQAVAAEQILITPKDFKSSISFRAIRPFDIIKFQNSESEKHHFYSLTKDFEFDLGVLDSGMTRLLQFKSIGIVDIQCRQHPQRKITLFVRDKFKP